MKRKTLLKHTLLTYAGFSMVCLVLCLVPTLHAEAVFRCWYTGTMLFQIGLAGILLVSITQKGAPCHKRRNPRRRSIQDWRD